MIGKIKCIYDSNLSIKEGDYIVDDGRIFRYDSSIHDESVAKLVIVVDCETSNYKLGYKYYDSIFDVYGYRIHNIQDKPIKGYIETVQINPKVNDICRIVDVDVMTKYDINGRMNSMICTDIKSTKYTFDSKYVPRPIILNRNQFKIVDKDVRYEFRLHPLTYAVN